MLLSNEGRIKLTDFGLSKLDLDRNKSKYCMSLSIDRSHVVSLKTNFSKWQLVERKRKCVQQLAFSLATRDFVRVSKFLKD